MDQRALEVTFTNDKTDEKNMKSKEDERYESHESSVERKKKTP